MAKRTLEMKRHAREVRAVRKVRAAEDRAAFRESTNSCAACGTVLEPHVVTITSGGRVGRVEMDWCPRCEAGVAA